MHLFLTIITGGLWLPVWIYVAFFGKDARRNKYLRQIRNNAVDIAASQSESK